MDRSELTLPDSKSHDGDLKSCELYKENGARRAGKKENYKLT